MNDDQELRQIYRKIGERVQNRDVLSELDLKTIFHQLIRLPEAYKLDFIEVHLPDVLLKSSRGRDEQLLEHYKHYVSVKALAALLAKLRASAISFEEPIIQLLEHIRNLQLMPGPATRDREQMEQLQFDLIYLLQGLYHTKDKVSVDLSSPPKRKQLAIFYYERIMSSFVSVSEDQLVTEPEFVENLKLELLKDKTVQTFAATYSHEVEKVREHFLKDLGKVMSWTIQGAYLKNYEGIFNCDRETVLAQFADVIEHRCLDADNDREVDLSAVTSSILAVVLELVFNDGFGAFRETLTQSVLKSLEQSHG